MNAASRSSGVAPLSVHFDALAADSGVLQAPGIDYLDYDYQWDFGDPDAGTWTLTTGKPRNEATGFVAGHVYTEPGTYTVGLTVRTPQGDVQRYQQTIEVDSAEGWTTYYVAANGSDGNTGTSPQQPLASLAHAIGLSAPQTRILFRRGDTFASVDGVVVSGAGPRIVGAYGEGPRPILRTTGTAATSSSVFRVGFAGIQGWRFVSLDLRGNTASSDNAAFWGIGTGQPLRDLLFLDVQVVGFRSTGIILTRNECDNDHLFIVSTRIRDIPRSWAAYIDSSRMALLGNDFDKQDESGSHTLRVPCSRRSAISHNRLWSAFHSTVKLHGESSVPGRETEDLVIADNHFHGSNWMVALGPQDSGSDESVRRVLYERNLHTTVSRTGTMLMLWTRDVLVRNNVFVAGAERESSTAAIRVYRLGLEPSPSGNRILHNTFHNAGSAHGLDAVTIGLVANTQPVYDTEVRNNLVSRVGNAPLRVLYDWGVGVGTVASHNLHDPDLRFENPAAGDFRLLADSPAIDAGIPLGVRYDYRGIERDGAPDVGAFEHEIGHGIFADGFESIAQAGASAKNIDVNQPPDPGRARPYPCLYIHHYVWDRGDGLGPLSGYIFWPSSTCSAADGPPSGAPTMIFNRGNGPKIDRYSPLMEQTARNGVVSVLLDYGGDEFLRPSALASYLTSFYERWPWRQRLAKRTILAGHSQGGQAAVLAARSLRGNPLGIQVRGVAALTPMDSRRPALERHDAPALLVVAVAKDDDVLGLPADGVVQSQYGVQATGVALHDRAGCASQVCEDSQEGTSGSPRIEKTLLWGRGNLTHMSAGGVAESPDLFKWPIAKGERMVHAYLTAFLKLHLFGDSAQRGFLNGQWRPPSVSDVDLVLSYANGDRRRVIDNAENGQALQNTAGGSVDTHLVQLSTVDLRYFRSSPHASLGQNAMWASSGSYLQWNLPNASTSAGRLRNVSGYGHLSVRLAQVFGSVWNPPNRQLDFSVRLLGAQGWSQPVSISRYARMPYPTQFTCHTGRCWLVGYWGQEMAKSTMSSVRLPLRDFAGVDLSDVRAIRFEFDRPGSDKGEIILDNLEFVP